ncbi:TIGR02391 family protein [Kribbella sp. NPDC003505]|uniref:TIGR02391 family protein n=1 Tax=Kribbella sp. NPDC003505 TaxID=3154448 RepID=UPI0033BB380E
MRPEVAIAELEKLKLEAATPSVTSGGEAFTAWQARGKGLLIAAFSSKHHLVESFDDVRYGVTVAWSGMPESAWDEARHSGIREACGYLDAAIYELRLGIGNDTEPLDVRAYDAELWEHVKGLVEAEDWGKVASQTAIFVENHVREWAGNPTDKKGDPLYGQVLWQTVLADDSELRLGQRSAEWQGWRSLGSGFAQALRNVDVHRIQRRDDAKRYAVGVLGLGSLLLTQLRFEHSDILNEE